MKTSPRGRWIPGLLALGVLSTTIFAAPASSIPSRDAMSAGPARIPWTSGTITFRANLNKTLRGKDSYGAPLSLTERYRERAVFTLTGKSAGGDFMQAKMTGAGTGTSTYAGGQQGTCNLNTAPTNKWSYKGPARVKMTYSGNGLYVYAQPVTTKIHTVFTGCSGSQVPPLDRTASVPVNGFAFFTVKVSPKVRTVSGNRRYPVSTTLTNNQLSGRVGTATVSWALRVGSRSCVNPGTGKCP